VSEAIAVIVRTYPGWTLFCALWIGLAIVKGIVTIVRGRPVTVVAAPSKSSSEDDEEDES